MALPTVPIPITATRIGPDLQSVLHKLKEVEKPTRLVVCDLGGA